ncbi:MAG: polysaccharide transporter [Chitinophagaceae bacterium]|nr:polysaccharide transporter [Chitinophagaceae bacterium]
MNNKYRLALFVFSMLLTFSCVTHKKYPYLIPDSAKTNKDTVQLNTQRDDYLLQVGDVLDVKVASNVANDIEIFNKKFEMTNLTAAASAFASYLNGYIIDGQGFIDIPLIGKIKSQGLTCNQLNDTIKVKLAEYINYATVTTKLGVFRVTILGEVTVPGTKEIVNSYNLNIYQAIGLAGDATDIANKKKVKLIRKKGDQVTVVKLDLSSISMIGSPYYYLQPNDVLYIEPLKAKVFRSNAANISLTLSALTFIIVMGNYLSK